MKKICKQNYESSEKLTKQKLYDNNQSVIHSYGTYETQENSPFPQFLTQQILDQYEKYRKTTDCYYANVKCQVYVEYKNNEPSKITAILLSVSHSNKLSNEQIEKDMKENVINPILKEYKKMTKKTQIVINPSDKFTLCDLSKGGAKRKNVVVEIERFLM